MSDSLLKYASRTVVPRACCVLALAAGAAAGCTAEESSPVPSGVATGAIDFAVGPAVRRFELADARCASVTRAGQAYLNIVVPAAFETTVSGRKQRPDILSAQLPIQFQAGAGSVDEVAFGPEEPRYGASASALNVGFDGEVYPMIQILAQSARDMVDYRCRASRDGAEIELICNDALVFPWRNPGEVPGGSFRARFQCAPAAQE